MRKLFFKHMFWIYNKTTKPRKNYKIPSLKINMLVSANACKGLGCHRSTRLKSRMLRELASTTTDQVCSLWLVVPVRVTYPMLWNSYFCCDVCVQLLLPLAGGINDAFVFDIQHSNPQPGAGDWDHFWNIFDWQGEGEREGQGRTSHTSNYWQMASPVLIAFEALQGKQGRGIKKISIRPCPRWAQSGGEKRYEIF